MYAGKSANKHLNLENWKKNIKTVNNQYKKIIEITKSSGWLTPVFSYKTNKYIYPEVSKVILDLILFGTGTNTHIY
tara:strand:+ start:285 stop:512 length:228 start_codon:yes stop_codon:yes gene_type:complete